MDRAQPATVNRSDEPETPRHRGRRTTDSFSPSSSPRVKVDARNAHFLNSSRVPVSSTAKDAKSAKETKELFPPRRSWRFNSLFRAAAKVIEEHVDVVPLNSPRHPLPAELFIRDL